MKKLLSIFLIALFSAACFGNTREVTLSGSTTVGISGTPNIQISGIVCADNTTTSTLTANSIFTGEWCDVTNTAVIVVTTYSDVASTTNGLAIEWSSNSSDTYGSDVFTIPAATEKTFSFQPVRSYFRVKYTNGTSDQTTFDLETQLKGSYVKPSSHRIQDSISTDDDAELVKAVITGEDQCNAGTFVNQKLTTDGYAAISDNSNGLSIAQGKVTGSTFIHKFGRAPDFDIGDSFVTVWDGADDSLFSGSPPFDYTFSTTANIDTISSSDASDTEPIEIQGLDVNYDLHVQTATLNGQNDVTLDTKLIRVFRMKNVGTTDIAGNVYLRTEGSGQASGVPSTAASVRAIIEDGNNQTLMAIYTIPNGKTGYMRDWYAAQANATGGFFGTNGSSTIKLKARPFGQVFQLKHISSIKSDGTGTYQHNYKEPEVFAAKTDIIMEANTSVDSASVAAGFDIVLVDD